MPNAIDGGKTPEQMQALDAIKYALGLAKPEEKTRVKQHYQPTSILARMQENQITPNNWREKFTGDAFLDMGGMAGTLGGGKAAKEAAEFTMPALKQALGLGEQLAQAETKGIRAYHSSPHDFDRFDSSKIGTGEGAQTEGHGLYFAEAEPVAQRYRDDFSRNRGAATTYEVNLKTDPSRLWDMDAVVPSTHPLVGELMQVAENRIATVPFGNATHGALRARFLLSKDGVTGRDVHEAVANLHTNRIAHSEVDPDLADEFIPSQENAAGVMRKYGYDGIKYLDQLSRDSRQGTRNFVLFDDSLVEILRKYGLVPPIAAGAVAQGEE